MSKDADMAHVAQLENVSVDAGSDLEKDAPGTVIESAENPVNGRILVPHPTLDPNDPLVS
jgi:hypothetical protein